MNALVMVANGGQMPVHYPAVIGCPDISNDIVHSCWDASTRLKFLADWIFINGSHPKIASPGDFLEWAYDYTFIPSLVAWAALVIRDRYREYSS